MKGKSRILLVLILMINASCMATRFSNVWIDETYQKGPFKDVFIVAIFPNPERRIMVEDEMARQLRSRGVNAVLSYVEFEGKQPGKDEVALRLNKLGINAALVTKFIEKQYKRYDTYPDDYKTVLKQWETNRLSPPVPVESEPQNYAIIETSLYDVESQKMIWSARSETWIVGMDSRLTSSFVSTVLKKLVDDNMIK